MTRTFCFTIQYQESPHLLLGRWVGEVNYDGLQAAYEQVLAHAHRHQCRFWLLDMRYHEWHSAAFRRWFQKILAPRVVQELEASVFIAYVVSDKHRAAVNNQSAMHLLHHSTQVECYPCFFTDEASARQWLAYYQTHAPQK